MFDGVPNDKNKYARWLIGKPTVMEAYYRLGDWTSPSMALITEGIADAISCYEATGYPVLAAISKSQLVKAALAVKRKYPQIKIVAAVMITLSTPRPLVKDLVISAAFSSLELIKAFRCVPGSVLSTMSKAMTSHP